jgi:hypothetical protein
MEIAWNQTFAPGECKKVTGGHVDVISYEVRMSAITRALTTLFRLQWKPVTVHTCVFSLLVDMSDETDAPFQLRDNLVRKAAAVPSPRLHVRYLLEQLFAASTDFVLSVFVPSHMRRLMSLRIDASTPQIRVNVSDACQLAAIQATAYDWVQFDLYVYQVDGIDSTPAALAECIASVTRALGETSCLLFKFVASFELAFDVSDTCLTPRIADILAFYCR